MFSDQAEKFEKYYRCLLSPNKSVSNYQSKKKMANQAANAAAEAQLAVEQSKLPCFYADPKKDQFTADQWLERFENANTCSKRALKTTIATLLKCATAPQLGTTAVEIQFMTKK